MMIFRICWNVFGSVDSLRAGFNVGSSILRRTWNYDIKVVKLYTLEIEKREKKGKKLNGMICKFMIQFRSRIRVFYGSIWTFSCLHVQLGVHHDHQTVTGQIMMMMMIIIIMFSWVSTMIIKPSQVSKGMRRNRRSDH